MLLKGLPKGVQGWVSSALVVLIVIYVYMRIPQLRKIVGL